MTATDINTTESTLEAATTTEGSPTQKLADSLSKSETKAPETPAQVQQEANASEPTKKPETETAKPVAYAIKDGESLFSHQAFEEAAKKHGLSQDAAQDVFASLAPKLRESAIDAFRQQMEKQQDEWVAQVKADPELGGENLEKTLGLINTAIDRVLPDHAAEVRAFLKESRATDHPLVVRFFAAVGKSFSQDSKFPRGATTGGTSQLDPVSRLAAAMEGAR